MKNFFTSRVTHTVLILLAMAIVGAALWFLGPLFSFGGMTPLASVGMRVTVIVMLLALLLSILLKWPFHIVGIAALCLLIWHAGPLLAVGAMHPLASSEARTWAIALILAVYVIFGLIRLYLAVKADKDFMARLFHIDREKQPGNGAGESIKNVAAKVDQAVTQLKVMRSRGHGLLRLLEGKRYLYDLPWYVILGNSGAGKTTAIHNAGLKFPLAGYKHSAELIEGTANCDWSFTNDAVFIDTAGRYATQEVHQDSKINDAAEWQGFLRLLRKQRPRAPINGVVLTISVAELVADLPQRLVHAAALRKRLEELRADLGIRFPVYVMITQADRLSGFTEYFQSLTSEGRAQVWGCTLPRADGKGSHEDAMARLQSELNQLALRLKAGISTRHQEEFEEDRRRLLLALSSEFEGLLLSLQAMLEVLLQDSRFDNTQLHNTIRGVYFTSAIQVLSSVPANANTLVQRFLAVLEAPWRDGTVRPRPTSAHSYFLHDLFTKLIIPESHLVHPNLRWEFRFRMMKLIGHIVCLVLFVWLAGALVLSFAHNRDYLTTVTANAGVLKSQLTSLFSKTGTEQSQAVPDALSTSAELPLVRGLDLQEPGLDYRAGLYSAPPVVAAADTTYTRLQDSLLLPQILQRMEAVLRQAIQDGTGAGADLANGNDSKLAYDTLRIYLQLHDKRKFNAGDVKAWVLKDWESSDSAAVFGARASMLGHIDRLFSGSRAVQSPFVRDEELVHAARDFLSANSSTQRLYYRAKTAMQRDAPEEFTLTRAVGPQAGMVFARASGLPLDKGIPGLFTYEGYQQLFDKRLPEFVAQAQTDDAWVMGKELSLSAALQKKTAESAGGAVFDLASDPLTQDIRRQYLTEYAQRWTDYLDDVRAVTGTSIAFDLTVLRIFAAPDSPLARLARAAARETTLSRPLITSAHADKSLLDQAEEQLNKRASDLRKGLGVLPKERMERDLVDNQFAALREVVTGQADASAGAATQQVAQGKPALENIAGLVNQYYTLMVVTDTALSADSLPPVGTNVGATLKLEASKLPAPFKSVLTALADSGSAKITEGVAVILRVQARTQFDRIAGMLALQVSEPCKRSIEGRYPFAQSSQDVNIDDFTRIFAAGGAADEFFNKQLAPFVDTSVRPWRYKNPATASLLSPAEIAMADAGAMRLAPDAVSSAGTPTLLGELLTMLTRHGPNPDAFAKMQAIREAFFREPGSKKMAWKVDMKVSEIDPSIVELVTDIDGQTQRYVHGPVQVQTLSWPGPRGGAMAEITAMPRIRSDTSSVIANGPWALFRLMDKARLSGSASEGKLLAEFNFDGRRAVLDLNSGSLPMPLNSDLLLGFSCPGSA